jgi:hypothetical protein
VGQEARNPMRAVRRVRLVLRGSPAKAALQVTRVRAARLGLPARRAAQERPAWLVLPATPELRAQGATLAARRALLAPVVRPAQREARVQLATGNARLQQVPRLSVSRMDARRRQQVVRNTQRC